MIIGIMIKSYGLRVNNSIWIRIGIFLQHIGGTH